VQVTSNTEYRSRIRTKVYVQFLIRSIEKHWFELKAYQTGIYRLCCYGFWQEHNVICRFI